MTSDQLAFVQATQKLLVDPICLDDLEDKSERTLLYGYDSVHKTHHVFIKDGRIQVCKHWIRSNHSELIEVEEDADYVPSMRVYPTRSDFEFCRLLCQRGVYISFTSIDEEELKRTHTLRYFGHTEPNITERNNEDQELESA